MPDAILVPFDDSRPSREALEYALREYPEADVTALHVIGAGGYGEVGPFPHDWVAVRDDVRDEADRLLEEAAATAREFGVDLATAVEVGPPNASIVDYAESGGFDHVVMGSHGRTGVSRLLLGSVAETVVRRCSIPVTVVRARDRTATAVQSLEST